MSVAKAQDRFFLVEPTNFLWYCLYMEEFESSEDKMPSTVTLNDFFIIKILIKWGRILLGQFELRSRKFGQQGMAGGQPTEDGLLYSNLTLHFPHLKD